MTRVTNFGRKRTYVQAGFESNADLGAADLSSGADAEATTPPAGTSTAGEGATSAVPPKKKRKRTPKTKRDNYVAPVKEGPADGGDADQDPATEAADQKKKAKAALKNKKKKERAAKAKVRVISDSERRRQKRIEERQADTTCFACREKGHAAKDCPVTRNGGSDDKSGSKAVVGICYRCGSTRHTLARCKKPVDNSNPLPFASCFVCSGKGHLASSCPQNKSKGIYPNGGSCKLCGDITHLAKNCGLRKEVSQDNTLLLGTGREAGADEDDFHTFKRRNTEVDREEKHQDQLKRTIDVKVGAHSGMVKVFGKPAAAAAAPAKKVVYF